MRNQIILGVVLSIIAVMCIFSLSGCATSHLMKDCKPVTDSNRWDCKNLKPWE